jgi:hypothetical protein
VSAVPAGLARRGSDCSLYNPRLVLKRPPKSP